MHAAESGDAVDEDGNAGEAARQQVGGLDERLDQECLDERRDRDGNRVDDAADDREPLGSRSAGWTNAWIRNVWMSAETVTATALMMRRTIVRRASSSARSVSASTAFATAAPSLDQECLDERRDRDGNRGDDAADDREARKLERAIGECVDGVCHGSSFDVGIE